MRLETLKSFHDLAETKSFAGAAERNGITQSALSQMLAAMERNFDLRLADRNKYSFQLTPAGQVCHEYCRQMVGLADALVAKLNQIRAGSGALEIAACPCIRLYRLPPLLRSFRQSCPGITVRVRHESHAGVHQAVLNNRVDASLVPYPRHEPGLAVAIFRQVPLVLACHPEHPLATQPVVTIRQLKNRSIIVWNQIPWLPLLSGVRVNERHFFEPHHECDQVEGVKRMVEIDDGIAILPEALVQSEVAGQTLAAVPFANSERTEPLAVIYREQKKLTPAMINFINALKQPVPAN